MNRFCIFVIGTQSLKENGTDSASCAKNQHSNQHPYAATLKAAQQHNITLGEIIHRKVERRREERGKMKEKLLKEIKRATEETKDYTKFIHLFGDSAESVLTRLNKTVRTIGILLKAYEIKEVCNPTKPALKDGIFPKSGCLVKIRPCGEEYKNKTYIGFYIGDLALGSSISVKENKIQVEFSGHNPAIFVPELRKVVYGYESWWGQIKDESELESITDEDIQNVWYVKLLRDMKKTEDAQQKDR